jgi:hypothetical protein
VTGPAVDARSWRRAAFGLFAVAAGTNVPTPLLLIYRDTLDLDADVLTAVFGCYALGSCPRSRWPVRCRTASAGVA